MCDIDGVLAARGILAQAERAGWQQHTLTRDGKQYHGWSFPVLNAEGKPHDRPRWKNSNGNGPKYDWPQKQPPNAKYYFLPGLRTAIETAGGTLYLAAGEPDVLTYHAAGIQNVLCWFNGENAIPATLAADLKYLSVNHVIYAPDRDETGMRSAARLVEKLRGTEITHQIAKLPGDLGSKADINSIWIDCGFDAGQFLGAIFTEEIDSVELAMYASVSGKTDAETRGEVEQKLKSWRNAWIDELRRVTQPDPKKHAHCPLPGHEDRNPSFRWTDEKTPGFFWPVCSCGIQDNASAPDVIAESINYQSWTDYKKLRAEREGLTLGQQRPSLRDPVTGEPAVEVPQFMGMKAEYHKLAAEITGEREAEGDPVLFPFKVLHKFGGFCEYGWTGKAVAVGGISGGGKTNFLTALALAFLLSGYDIAWWGPEWSPAEYAARHLQMLGGLNFRQLNHLRVIRALMRDGMSLERALAQTGIAYPTQAEREKSIEILRQLATRPGEMYVIAQNNIPVNVATDRVKAWANARRADGGKPIALFWDYLQLSQAPGGGNWNWGDHVATEIKNACAWSEANLITFISSQPKKGDAERVREDQQKLKVGSFQGLTEAIFNLALTITPGYDDDGNKLDWAALSVEKNSMGQTGMVAVPVRWSQLAFLDEELPINLKAYFDKQKKQTDWKQQESPDAD